MYSRIRSIYHKSNRVQSKALHTSAANNNLFFSPHSRSQPIHFSSKQLVIWTEKWKQRARNSQGETLCSSFVSPKPKRYQIYHHKKPRKITFKRLEPENIWHFCLEKQFDKAFHHIFKPHRHDYTHTHTVRDTTMVISHFISQMLIWCQHIQIERYSVYTTHISSTMLQQSSALTGTRHFPQGQTLFNHPG